MERDLSELSRDLSGSSVQLRAAFVEAEQAAHHDELVNDVQSKLMLMFPHDGVRSDETSATIADMLVDHFGITTTDDAEKFVKLARARMSGKSLSMMKPMDGVRQYLDRALALRGKYR